MRERKRECREDVPVQRASSPERQTDKPVGEGCAWADSSTVRGWTKYGGRGSRVEKSRKGYRVPASRRSSCESVLPHPPIAESHCVEPLPPPGPPTPAQPEHAKCSRHSEPSKASSVSEWKSSQHQAPR